MQLNLLADVIMGSSPTGDTLNLEAGLEFHQGKVFFGDIYLNRSPIKTTNPVKTAEAGDIVICVRAPVGEVNIVDRKICIGRGLASLKAKRNVPTRFLFHLLRLQKKNFDLIASGSTFASITVEQLKNIAFITPPYEQQLRIADIIHDLNLSFLSWSLICLSSSLPFLESS